MGALVSNAATGEAVDGDWALNIYSTLSVVPGNVPEPLSLLNIRYPGHRYYRRLHDP